jgi:hypothetical protein
MTGLLADCRHAVRLYARTPLTSAISVAALAIAIAAAGAVDFKVGSVVPLAFIVVGWLRADYVSRDISILAVTIAIVAGLGLILIAASLGPAREVRRTEPAPLLKED